MESIFMPLVDKLSLVGILPSLILHMKTLSLIGTQEFHLVAMSAYFKITNINKNAGQRRLKDRSRVHLRLSRNGDKLTRLRTELLYPLCLLHASFREPAKGGGKNIHIQSIIHCNILAQIKSIYTMESGG